MLKYILSLFLLSGYFFTQARTLEVGAGKEYDRLQVAATQAKPGDIILIRKGIYSGNEFIPNLAGTSKAWITIKGATGEKVIFTGGKTAIQMSNPVFVKIENLIFEGQSENGVNIDDGGTYKATAHHLTFENCEWRNMTANGNNDELKISGIEDFIIRKCQFINGSPGGSLLDMVGCHNGIIEQNIFENGGSNSIQAKGGTKNITIRQNTFNKGGERTLNIGGSTGLEFFRPNGATYEASDIKVYSNFILGSGAAFAFVGAINCSVINNTIAMPDHYVIRILQENNNPGLQPCGNNQVINNIFLYTTKDRPAINIGGKTAPETFTFSHNIWYNPERKIRAEVEIPVKESNQYLNLDPQFEAGYGIKKVNLKSPVKGIGKAVLLPDKDFNGKVFLKNRSVGAVEIGK